MIPQEGKKSTDGIHAASVDSFKLVQVILLGSRGYFRVGSDRVDDLE